MSPAEKFRAAMLMHTAGISMKRLSLKRSHPEWTEEELEARLLVWIAEPR